jgi:aspartyl-tRNA(Asn)/glutamyl-tRNA(Gln) amidotransferase subunit C
MSLTPDDVKKIAHLARLTMSDQDVLLYTQQLSNIVHTFDQMNNVQIPEIPTQNQPEQQRLRADKVTEQNQREAFQAIAPKVESGLYLVPKVIE